MKYNWGTNVLQAMKDDPISMIQFWLAAHCCQHPLSIDPNGGYTFVHRTSDMKTGYAPGWPWGGVAYASNV